MIDGISVIICCYNSQNRIISTLEHLCGQNFFGLWEVILVDNNCTDNTIEISRNLWERSGLQVPLKVVREIRPGLSRAREKGIINANFNCLIFCDDDNWLDENYLKNAHMIMLGHPEVGVAGGINLPTFEGKIPDWFEQYKSQFAVGKQSDTEGDITRERGYVWGAGMVIRKEAICQIMINNMLQILNQDRVGKKFTAGGDSEICFALRNKGWSIYYSEKLILHHYMPTKRLQWDTLRKMYFGFGVSSVSHDIYIKPESRYWGKLRKSLEMLWIVKFSLLRYYKLQEGKSAIMEAEFHLGRIYALFKNLIK